MANGEIDLYDGGGLQPYSPSQPLAPAPDFGTTDVDLLHESYTGGGQYILGEPLPPGVSIQQVTQAYQQLGNVFVADFLQLGHNVSQTQKAVAWFMDALKNPPQQQRQHHRYNLFEHADDPIFQAFANYAHDNGFSAKFVQECCWWVSEASRKLAARAPANQAPVTARPSGDPTASLTDSQYEVLVQHNEAVKARTMAYMARKYGYYSYKQVLDIAQKYLDALPAQERRALDTWTGEWPWTHSLNSIEVLDFLVGQSIGIANTPQDGAGISQEIALCEKCMRENRASWLKDDALQARYRMLINLRDRG
jgi:hypothetical protein